MYTIYNGSATIQRIDLLQLLPRTYKKLEYFLISVEWE